MTLDRQIQPFGNGTLRSLFLVGRAIESKMPRRWPNAFVAKLSRFLIQFLELTVVDLEWKQFQPLMHERVLAVVGPFPGL